MMIEIKFSLFRIDPGIADHIVNIVTAVVEALGGDLIVEIKPLEIPNEVKDEVENANELATDD